MGSEGQQELLWYRSPTLIPGSGRSLGEGNGNSSILARRIPWTEESGCLQSMELQNTNTHTLTHTHTHTHRGSNPELFMANCN